MTEQPNVTISIVVPDAAQPTLAEYRASQPDLDSETLAIVDELLANGRTEVPPRA